MRPLERIRQRREPALGPPRERVGAPERRVPVARADGDDDRRACGHGERADGRAVRPKYGRGEREGGGLAGSRGGVLG